MMKVLFIGGTGVISSACSKLAIEQGFELYLLNRGQTSTRPIPKEAKVLLGDIRDPSSIKTVLRNLVFDVVVDWVAYTPDHIKQDLELFRDRASQYIFISSASAYQTPPSHLPITESTLLHNPFWKYSQDKIACEDTLIKAYRDEGFPITIVRPSHTYDRTLLPMRGGYTMVHRMRAGKPVIVHGDGTSLWTLTHHQDFAKGFNGLIGNPHAIGEIVHITSDESLSWNQIYTIVAKTAVVVAPDLVHIPSEFIARYDPDWGASLLGDKSHSMIFDNSKIKRLVPGFKATIPFWQGAKEIINWYDSDRTRQVMDKTFDQRIDHIIDNYKKALKSSI
jgi:nucleoside-diphosphate-sugar epimerase